MPFRLFPLLFSFDVFAGKLNIARLMYRKGDGPLQQLYKKDFAAAIADNETAAALPDKLILQTQNPLIKKERIWHA